MRNASSSALRAETGQNSQVHSSSKRLQSAELHSITMRSQADTKSAERRRKKDDDFGSAWASFKASLSALF